MLTNLKFSLANVGNSDKNCIVIAHCEQLLLKFMKVIVLEEKEDGVKVL